MNVYDIATCELLPVDDNRWTEFVLSERPKDRVWGWKDKSNEFYQAYFAKFKQRLGEIVDEILEMEEQELGETLKSDNTEDE